MTRSQFARSVFAGEKWVENSARLLNRRLRYTAAEARWLGLVRVLNQEVGLTLGRAAGLADEALRHRANQTDVLLGGQGDASAAVTIDLARYHSAYIAAMSAALILGGARRRGRRAGHSGPPRRTRKQVGRVRPSPKRAVDALTRAASYGVDVSLLREGLRTSPAERLKQLDENAGFIREMRRSREHAVARSAAVQPKSRG